MPERGEDGRDTAEEEDDTGSGVPARRILIIGRRDTEPEEPPDGVVECLPIFPRGLDVFAEIVVGADLVECIRLSPLDGLGEEPTDDILLFLGHRVVDRCAVESHYEPCLDCFTDVGE